LPKVDEAPFACDSRPNLLKEPISGSILLVVFFDAVVHGHFHEAEILAFKAKKKISDTSVRQWIFRNALKARLTKYCLYVQLEHRINELVITPGCHHLQLLLAHRVRKAF